MCMLKYFFKGTVLFFVFFFWFIVYVYIANYMRLKPMYYFAYISGNMSHIAIAFEVR